MFTGIVEGTGKLREVKNDGQNVQLFVSWKCTDELKIDQSLSHNGVCLTVEEIHGDTYRVTAIKETIKRTNFKNCKPGDLINLERSMQLNDRLDGHLVQGHVDDVIMLKEIKEIEGSWLFTFEYDEKYAHLLVEKGSVCLNGVSLTVVDCNDSSLSVAIIPYTFQNTNFSVLKEGTLVNVEFDILGKYITRQLENRFGSIT